MKLLEGSERKYPMVNNQDKTKTHRQHNSRKMDNPEFLFAPLVSDIDVTNRFQIEKYINYA